MLASIPAWILNQVETDSGNPPQPAEKPLAAESMLVAEQAAQQNYTWSFATSSFSLCLDKRLCGCHIFRKLCPRLGFAPSDGMSAVTPDALEDDLKFLTMVGATGIEPVTPTMST
jgi:hypothetical protein